MYRDYTVKNLEESSMYTNYLHLHMVNFCDIIYIYIYSMYIYICTYRYIDIYHIHIHIYILYIHLFIYRAMKQYIESFLRVHRLHLWHSCCGFWTPFDSHRVMSGAECALKCEQSRMCKKVALPAERIVLWSGIFRFRGDVEIPFSNIEHGLDNVVAVY